MRQAKDRVQKGTARAENDGSRSRTPDLDSYEPALINRQRVFNSYTRQPKKGLQLEPSRKPLNLLIRKLNGDISIKLKNDTEYRGKIIDCDSHMNIILDGAREYRGGDPATNFGSLIVRGSNVLYICVAEPTH